MLCWVPMYRYKNSFISVDWTRVYCCVTVDSVWCPASQLPCHAVPNYSIHLVRLAAIPYRGRSMCLCHTHTYIFCHTFTHTCVVFVLTYRSNNSHPSLKLIASHLPSETRVRWKHNVNTSVPHEHMDNNDLYTLWTRARKIWMCGAGTWCSERDMPCTRLSTL